MTPLDASALTTVAFGGLVILMTALAIAALVRALPARGAVIGAAVILLLYLVLPGILAGTGRLNDYGPPPTFFMVMGLLTLVTVVTAFSDVGSRLIMSLGLPLIVGYQFFRVAVEILLHRLYLEGVIPEVMTYSGRNFDILTGIFGGVLGLLLLRRRLPRAIVLGWNVLGICLLANIVAIAVLATPAFRFFAEGPPNLLPSTFPFVWLPTVLVQLALFGHLLVFRVSRNAPAGHEGGGLAVPGPVG